MKSIYSTLIIIALASSIAIIITSFKKKSPPAPFDIYLAFRTDGTVYSDRRGGINCNIPDDGQNGRQNSLSCYQFGTLTYLYRGFVQAYNQQNVCINQWVFESMSKSSPCRFPLRLANINTRLDLSVLEPCNECCVYHTPYGKYIWKGSVIITDRAYYQQCNTLRGGYRSSNCM